ncbi:MAG: PilZ domain-containing protein, partial [Deltaproteobacteria bacterium]|nr:PilZ domain-containing protein [Deltaproteobacteria bacterium]
MSDSERERRRNTRRMVPSTAVLFLEGIELGMYGVDNLSPAGALLTGDIAALQGDMVTVLLVLDGRRPVEVDGLIVRLDRSVGSTVRMGIAFEHSSSATEDALSETLYGVSAIPDREDLAFPRLEDVGDP